MFVMFIRRYLPAYFFVMFLSLCAFVTFFNLVDGFVLNLIAWLALFLVALLGIPVLIIRDFLDIKNEAMKHAAQINEIRRGGGDIGPYQEMAIEKIAERTGVPVLLVSWLVSKGKGVLSGLRAPLS